MRRPPPAAARREASPRLLRIAHRGASARAPENTFAAFEEAVRVGVDAVELDVHLSADGVPVVIHDATVERTTDGRGAVASHTCARLRRLDAGSWFSPRYRGERIPTLDETLDWAGGRTGLNVELKAEATAGGTRSRGAGPGAGPQAAPGLEALVRAVALSLRRARFGELLILSSFDARALVLTRAVLPKVRLGLLVSRSTRGLARLHRRVGLYALHPHRRLAKPRVILGAHARGLALLVWPVNDLALMRRLKDRGADGLMSDDPALFHRL